jgi:predicted GH43/DUF377 family glycosyl hydrolase
MLIRGVGYKDNLSRLGYAKSSDGIKFKINPEPVLEPIGMSDNQGVEDPRFTKLDKPMEINGKQYKFVGTYTAVQDDTARIALTTTNDFHTFTKPYLMLPNWDLNHPESERDLWNTPSGRSIIFPGFKMDSWVDKKQGNWTKAAGIFPKKIQGKYWALWGEYKIRAATSGDFRTWEVINNPVLSTREGMFDQAYLEMGPPPIETSYGWLVIYNGVNSLEQSGRFYSIGWAMLNKADPTKVIARCHEPILIPEKLDEITGEIDTAFVNGKNWNELTPTEFEENKHKIPKAVFCNGAVDLGKGKYALYYGAGDKRIKRAELILKLA